MAPRHRVQFAGTRIINHPLRNLIARRSELSLSIFDGVLEDWTLRYGVKRGFDSASVTLRAVTMALLVCCMAVAVGDLPSERAVAGAATPRHELLDAAQARTVFTSLWPKFALAYATQNSKGIDHYTDSDVQKAIDGWLFCGCGPLPTRYQRVNMTAPSQTAYPLSFLAEVQVREYTGQTEVVEAVYTKESSRSSWLIAYLVPYIDGAPLLDSSTMNLPAPKVPVDVAAVGTQIASFFQTVFDSGQPPNSWPQTGSLQEETQRLLSDREYMAQNHLVENLTYLAGPHSLAFANPQGVLMCGEVRSHSVITPSTPGGFIVQPPDQSFLGTQLAPGSYSSVTSSSLRDDCWRVTPQGTTQPLSFFGGVYSRTGALTQP